MLSGGWQLSGTCGRAEGFEQSGRPRRPRHPPRRPDPSSPHARHICRRRDFLSDAGTGMQRGIWRGRGVCIGFALRPRRRASTQPRSWRGSSSGASLKAPGASLPGRSPTSQEQQRLGEEDLSAVCALRSMGRGACNACNVRIRQTCSASDLASV